MTTSAYLDNLACDRVTYECTGVKICEHLDLRIRNQWHSSISKEIWDIQKSLRLERQAYSPRRDALR